MPKVDHSARGEIFRASRSREGGSPLAKEHKTKTELEIRASAAEKFTTDVRLLATWEAPPHVTLYEPNFVRWIPDFVPGPYFVFFDDPDNALFEVEKPWQLIVIFERIHRREIYHITNRYTDYLITIDQNNLVHGQGTAETWLRTGTHHVFKLLGVPANPTPGAITSSEIETAQFGRQIRFHCQLAAQSFTLTLDGCGSTEWRSLTHRPPATATLDYIYIAELNRGRYRVSVSAPSFRLFTLCESVTVEKQAQQKRQELATAPTPPPEVQQSSSATAIVPFDAQRALANGSPSQPPSAPTANGNTPQQTDQEQPTEQTNTD